MPGEIVHIEIPADDTKRGQEFWGSLFGWQFRANPGPFEYHTAQIGGEQGAAITNMEPGKRGTRPYFAVDDIKAGAAPGTLSAGPVIRARMICLAEISCLPDGARLSSTTTQLSGM